MMRLFDARKKITARELADRFQVSIRTIQRDLEKLQELGFPLYAEAGAHGGYRVLPNRILPPLQLTRQEALGLFLMLQWLERIPDFPHGAIRERLADHYYGSLPADVQEQISKMRKHIAFLQPNPSFPAPYTTLALQAAVDHRMLRFVYGSRSGDKTVEAYPLGLYYEHGYWYMPAKRNDKVLLYRVDRMQEAEAALKEDHGVPPLLSWMAAGDDREGELAVVRFTAFGERLAQSDSMFQAVNEREWRGIVPEEEMAYVARKLLAYGAEAEAIAPPKLRGMMAEMLENAAGQYRK